MHLVDELLVYYIRSIQANEQHYLYHLQQFANLFSLMASMCLDRSKSHEQTMNLFHQNLSN